MSEYIVYKNKIRKRLLRHMLSMSLLIFFCFIPFKADAAADWEVALSVSSGNAAYNRLILGADNTATDGHDNIWDTYALLGGTVQAYFPHPEWGLAQQEFHRDIRAHSPGSTIEWSMTVNSSLTNADFTISWRVSSIPENNPVVLIDDFTGQQIDMRSASSYNFTYTATCSFRLRVTEPSTCSNDRVRIAGTTPAYYPSLQAAYNAAANGETIQSRGEVLTENLNINLDKSVTITGGYDCNYTDNSGNTTLDGTLIISNGNVSIENIIVQ